MKSFLLIFCVFYSLSYAQVEEVVLEDDDIGPYLVYDCVKKHWNCVSEAKNQECEKSREEDRKAKSYRHSCASIEKLPSNKGCFQRQLFYTTKNHGTRFCVKDEWKEKADI